MENLERENQEQRILSVDRVFETGKQTIIDGVAG